MKGVTTHGDSGHSDSRDDVFSLGKQPCGRDLAREGTVRRADTRKPRCEV